MVLLMREICCSLFSHPTRRSAPLLSVTLLAFFYIGCSEEIPTPSPRDQKPAQDALTDAGKGETRSGDSAPCSASWTLPDVNGNSAACHPSATDYQPGDTADPWAPCISDDTLYHPFDPSISSIARVAAFEQIASLLLTATPPASDQFVQAKLAYTQAEGIDSRVSRREDEHYPAASKACADMTQDEIAKNKDRCVGQGKLQPLLNEAFAAGASGKDPLVNAARIEATLLWFLYVSAHKEATTCSKTKKDCDSSYAYYTGGEPRNGGKGLARYIHSVSTQTHDRVWDGILAVRCWRDIDGNDLASQLALRDQAVAQMDRALLRGLSLIVKSRAKALADACTAMRPALWASVQILGGVLDREATVRDAVKAQTLRAELAKQTPAEANVALINDTLETIFPCP
jgi:hypothetical protein